MIIESEIQKCLNKYIKANNLSEDILLHRSSLCENDIKITRYYNNKTIITVYEDKTSGEVGIIENWKVK